MYELGKTVWSDDHPELYGEALDFDALANVESNELLLYDDDAAEPFGGVICKLAVYTEHGIMLDTGGEKLTAVDRDELEEEAGIWRLKTDGIEALGLDEKTLNHLHKNCPEINTISKLIGTMYLPDAFEKINTQGMKRIESALKKNGIIKYMRGDWVDESDIDPEPLTWEQLHDYVGKLLVHDCSTASQRCLKLVWIYKIEDSGDTCLSYLDGGTSFSNTRKGYINGDKNPITPNLAHEGQFFVLKNQRLDINRESTDEMPMKETVPMLTEKQQAEVLHKQIIGYGEVIYQSLYGMCTAIKQMRDSKLYKALGYDTFEAYTEEKLGMKRRQAYTYISIADKLSADFVQSTAQIGAEKLYLLSRLDEDQREELTQTVDIGNTTVRELKAQIAQLTQERNTARAEAQHNKALIGEAERAWNRAEERITALTAQVQELESRPVEVAVPEPSREVQNMQDAMRRINLEHEQWSAKMQDDHIRHVQEINRQHRAETDALRAEYEEKLAAAQASPAETPEPDSKEIFKVYLANAIDAAKRMTAFLAAHPNEACRAQAEKFFQAMIGEVSK